MKKIEDYVLSIPDFPEPGVIFRDITSVLQDADGLQYRSHIIFINHLYRFVKKANFPAKQYL